MSIAAFVGVVSTTVRQPQTN